MMQRLQNENDFIRNNLNGTTDDFNRNVESVDHPQNRNSPDIIMLNNHGNTPQLIHQPNSNLNDANVQNGLSESINHNNETQPILRVNKRTQTQQNENGDSRSGL